MARKNRIKKIKRARTSIGKTRRVVRGARRLVKLVSRLNKK